MQKWTAFLFAAVAVAAVAVIVGQRPVKGGAAPATSSTVEAASDAGPSDAGARVVAAAEPRDAGEPDEPTAMADPLNAGSDAGGTLLDGAAPPSLAGDAPKSVAFGVILVTYRGAQGAPANARSRAAALDLATQLAAEAKQDFKAAVAKGDKGSQDNAGHIPRGVLEPAPEFVLFSLPKDGVSEPVDTPRGFWIVHRIE